MSLTDIEHGRALAESGQYMPAPPAYEDTPLPPEPEPIPDEWTMADDHETAISYRIARLRVEREARRRLDAEDRPPVAPPPVHGLVELLNEPDAETRYRIDQLAPAGGRVMLSAQYKAGKTTLVGNLLRSLADGEPFLDRFDVKHAQRVVLIDTELDEHTLRRWLRDQQITNPGAIADVVALRGRVAAFNLLDNTVRESWARRLTEISCDYLILDCLRPVLDALGLDEHRDAGQFLVAFDALLQSAGITDALVVQHMGHTNERARGDSRLQDWPDASWRLVREDTDPSSPRFFSAYGRDVDISEGRLSFDPQTRRLSFSGGSRRDTKTEAATPDLIAVLAEHAQQAGDGLSGRAIETAMANSDHTRNAIREALGTLVTRGLATVTNGPARSKLHRLTNPCAKCGYPLTAGQTGQHNECRPTPPEADK